MEDNLSVLSLNVNGLNDIRKRRLALKYLKSFKKSIILLQETHCRRGTSRLWASQWGHVSFFTESSASQGGVAILFSKDLNPVIQEVIYSPKDRFIICKCTIREVLYLVATVYMPTSDHEQEQIEVLNDLLEKIGDDLEPNLFLGGDFNVPMHPTLDRQGYVHSHIPNLRFLHRLQQSLDQLDLVDVWRIQHPDRKTFTWSRSSKLSRLDYIFAPNSILGAITSSHPITCPFSDHRLIKLTLNPNETERGRGYWRLNPSLLDREDFRSQLNNFLTTRLEDTTNLPPDIRWEYIKLGIREFSIKFNNDLKARTLKLEGELEKRLSELEEEMISSEEAIEEFHGCKRELYQIQLLRSRQAMLKSRCTWLTQGERPTKYFLNLEKRNYDEKSVTSMFDNTDTLLTSQTQILSFEKEHFANQHANIASNTGHDPFCPPPLSVLDDLDRMVLNSEVSVEELEIAMKKMKSGKSPGCDGIPVELYKRFWHVLGGPLLNCLVSSLQKGLLTPNQRRAVITLIPKKNRDRRYISNWRPISVLNVDFKILSKALAARLAGVLPKLTHNNQMGFVPTRFIGDNIRNVQSIIEFLSETARQGLIVSLDFKAAFDSLNHHFLFRVLETYHLGDKFNSWVKTLYTSVESCILNRGHSSGWFSFNRGVRQGCPISPYLFVLAVERLACSIRANKHIRGIDLLSSNTKIQQFADDSTLFVADEASLLTALESVDEFRQYSGLELNLVKTKGLNVGDILLESQISASIDWKESIEILGITLSKEPTVEKDFDLNFAPCLKKMHNVCAKWSNRNVTLKGKVVILNTLVLPIIYYQCQMLHVQQRVHCQVNNLISKFLWGGKRPKISKACLELPTISGGLGLHCFKNRVAASKISWVKRASCVPTQPWHFYLEFRSDMSTHHLFLERTIPRRIRGVPFLSEVFHAWHTIYLKEPCTDLSIRNESLWGNSFLRGKFKKKWRRWCQDRDIFQIKDLLYMDHVISERQFIDRFGLQPPNGMLQHFERIVPEHWLEKLLPINQSPPPSALYVSTQGDKSTDICSLSTKKMYSLLEAMKRDPYSCSQRWERVYGDGVLRSHIVWKHWHLLPYKITHSVQLQNFMYRIAYRVIPTQVYLHQIKVADSDTCPACHGLDDLLHFLFECPKVKEFWDSLATWVDANEHVMNFPEDLSEEEFLLGTTTANAKHYLFNYILMCAKFFVYKESTFGNRQYDLLTFLIELKGRLTIERMACFSRSTFQKRFQRWEPFYNSF